MDEFNDPTTDAARERRFHEDFRPTRRARRKASLHQFVYQLGVLRFDRWRLKIAVHIDVQREK